MNAKQHKNRILLAATAAEYTFVAVLLALMLTPLAGLSIGSTCLGVHLCLGKQRRLDPRWSNRIIWLVLSALVDFCFVFACTTVRFQAIGGRPFGNVEAISALAEFALQLAAGLAVIRLAITVAILLLQIGPKEEAVDPAIEPHQ